MLGVESIAGFYTRRAAEERELGRTMPDEQLRRSHFAAAERYDREAADMLAGAARR